MIDNNELSILREFKYIHLSDKISRGEGNLNGNWIRYGDDMPYQLVNFGEYVLKSGTTIYGDENIIYQKDGTIFISERSKDKFKSNGDVVGYLYNIENQWRSIKKEGNKTMPFEKWRKELHQFTLFFMFCILTIVGGNKGLLIGLVSSLVLGGLIMLIGHLMLFYKTKNFVREYIRMHDMDDFSKILIHDYLRK